MSRLLSFMFSLLVAGAPALAQDSSAKGQAAKPVAGTHAPLAKKPAVASSIAAAPKSAPKSARKSAATHAATSAGLATEEAAGDKPAKGAHHKGKTAEKTAHATAIPPAFAALPEDERLAIQADLAWLGDYDATANGDIASRTVEAIKSYQKRHGNKDTGVLSGEERAALAASVKGPEQAVGWRIIDDPATGSRLGLPTKVVSQSNPARVGSRWSSPHGQIQVETLRLSEAALPALFEDERRPRRQRAVEYSELRPDFFVISGMQGLKKFIMRVEARGSELRGITVLYDQATEGTMAPVALAMANTFQGFPDPTAPPPAGRKRGVEYATGIVVDSHGYLLTLYQVTDECRSITVPGFGHAERVAEDKNSDLALLRLYGARNLTPVALGAEVAKTGDVTLVGVADPLTQAGAAKVTTTPAHLTAQGIDPPPKLGFSGAAAIDAQGRFVGMAEVRAPVVAGAAPLSQQAALIPADTIRAFLAAQEIAPAPGRATIDQSVLRVICVRN